MPKINKLPLAENLTGFEDIPVVQNGKTVRTTIAKISAHMVFSFEEFADMDLSGKADGHIIYYSQVDGKWLTKPLVDNIDGGLF